MTRSRSSVGMETRKEVLVCSIGEDRSLARGIVDGRSLRLVARKTLAISTEPTRAEAGAGNACFIYSKTDGGCLFPWYWPHCTLSMDPVKNLVAFGTWTSADRQGFSFAHGAPTARTRRAICFLAMRRQKLRAMKNKQYRNRA